MVISIKRLLIVIGVIAILIFSGYLYVDNYVLNAKSDLDKKTVSEQEKQLLVNKEFADLPEVKALRQQLEQLNKEGSGDNTNPAADSAFVPSRQDIENGFRTKMAALQSEYNGRVNALIAQAKSEYVRARQENKKISTSALAQKYIGLAGGVEAECDARAYAAIAYTENELSRYGYDTGITEDAREAYQQAKSQRKKELLSRMTN